MFPTKLIKETRNQLAKISKELQAIDQIRENILNLPESSSRNQICYALERSEDAVIRKLILIWIKLTKIHEDIS